MRSRALAAWVSLAIYAATALVYPVLHRRHHALHGADHLHVGLGTIFTPAVSLAENDAAAHAAFDADLAALDLAEVASAGTLFVDCSLAAYTLAACETQRPDHPANFGDELLARSHRHAPPPPPWDDPNHGAGSLEHLSASALATQPFLLPPPVRAVEATLAAIHVSQFASAPRATHAPRGPPARA